MKKDYIALAFENLKHRGLRSWLTMLGIFIGIAAVVSLISLGNGLQQAILGQFNALSTDTLLIQNAGTGFGPPGSTSVAKLTSHDVKIIDSVSNIKEVIPRLIRVAKIEFSSAVGYGYLGSMPNNAQQIDFIYSSFGIKAAEGRLLRSGDNGKIVLGSDFAKDSNAFGKAIHAGDQIKINGKNFDVIGVLAQSSSFQFNSVILMTEHDMKDLMNIGDEIDVIVAVVNDQSKIDDTARQIETKMRKDRGEKVGEEDFTVQTPTQALSAVNTILLAVNIVVTGIAAISLLVGGIGIANTMFTSVLERTKEIGTMKAIGAKNSDILWIFLIESGMLGLTGGIIGAIIGIGAALGVSAVANAALGSTIISVTISWPLVFVAVAFSFIVGVGSGLIPALQASKLRPTEALRS